jgi:citrate synthase
MGGATTMREFSPGLAGVPAAKSSISYVDGQAGVLEYRGIRIADLAAHSTFIETSFLLLFGRLPTTDELHRFSQDIIHHRRVKYRITDLIKCLPEQGYPMDALQAAVAALGMYYPARQVLGPEVQYWSVVRLIAKVPTIVPPITDSDAGMTRFIHATISTMRATFSTHGDGKDSAPLIGEGAGHLSHSPRRTYHECLHLQRYGDGLNIG